MLSQERSRLESAREKHQAELEQQAEELERTQAELQKQKVRPRAEFFNSIIILRKRLIYTEENQKKFLER